MALTISNCFKNDATNYTYGNCCCSFGCTFTNDGARSIEITEADVFFDGLFSVQSFQIIYLASFVTVPFTMAPNTSFELNFEFCAGQIGDLDTLTFEFLVDSVDPYIFLYDFEAIDLSTTVDILSINFGTVNLNTINQVYLTINNPTTCCYNYDISTDCVDTIISPGQTRKLCIDNFEAIQITWQPTTVGPFNCEIIVGMDCQQLFIPVTGNVVEPPTPPSGGNDVSGKRTVVDCPSGNCGLFNPQPAFAQTTKNSIQQISRATLPKGGPGRGTNFGKK